MTCPTAVRSKPATASSVARFGSAAVKAPFPARADGAHREGSGATRAQSSTKEHVMTDGFELLEKDHRTVQQLFERYAEEPEDDHVREIIGHLTVHTEMEERALYPELRRYVDGGDDLADEAEAEHAAVRAFMGRIELSPPEDLSGLVEGMRTLVEQHVEQEEQSLFPAMRDAGVDAEALGDRLRAAEKAVAP